MGKQKISDKDAYNRITDACKKQKNGATIADIVGRTSLPLATVKELAPKVADEYSARLQVTESGEILYSFPRGFKSKYKGVGVFFKKLFENLGKGVKIFSSWLFKVWIMVMLVGYFALFMLLAVAALVLSVAGNRSDNDSGGGLALTHGLFNLIIRIWFYSEISKSLDPSYVDQRRSRPKTRPLHKAIFSFVFGDGDPNADWETRENQAVIAYIQANKGVISLPEYIMLTGKKPLEADSAITAFCAEFGGSPEATEEGTVVYRFDDLLLRADVRDRSFGSSAPVKRLEVFSANKAGMNTVFCAINGVNVLFGGYYLFNAINTGAVTFVEQIRQGREIIYYLSVASGEHASFLYGMTYHLASSIAANPLPLITIGLGVVPLVFSVLFWLIPAIRAGNVKKDNEAVKIENLRKVAFGRAWTSPQGIQSADIFASLPEASPKNMAKAQDKLVKEVGAYSQPDVSINENGATVYAFPELAREKEALRNYRASVTSQGIGGAVFDSDARVE